MNKSSAPIGIFDSGIGGLTVTKAIVEKLPHESIIYFGDTLHLPYGDKSKETLKSYSLNIADLLLSQNCKVILIACNAASAAAFDAVKEYVGDKAMVLNVIDPLINFLGANFVGQNIGLIATRQTVQSKVYNHKINSLNANINFTSLATPLLVPVIEEGFSQHQIVDLLLAEYLAAPSLQNIDALILGCTHYPVLKNNIVDYYKKNNKANVQILESSKVVADNLKAELETHQLLNENKTEVFRRFYVSEYTEAFAEKAKVFFGENVDLRLFHHEKR